MLPQLKKCTRQHLCRRRIFAKSVGVARKSREVTGSHPDLCHTVEGSEHRKTTDVLKLSVHFEVKNIN